MTTLHITSRQMEVEFVWLQFLLEAREAASSVEEAMSINRDIQVCQQKLAQLELASTQEAA